MFRGGRRPAQVALGPNAKDLRAVEAGGLDGLDAAAWARLSLPEGPAALASYRDTAAYVRRADDFSDASRRACHVDIPRGRVAAPPRVPRG